MYQVLLGLEKYPSNWAAHAKRHRLEDSAAARHDQLSEGGGEGGDDDTTQDFVRYMVVLDLADFASAQRKGAAHVYQKHLRRCVFGRTKSWVVSSSPPSPPPSDNWSWRTATESSKRCLLACAAKFEGDFLKPQQYLKHPLYSFPGSLMDSNSPDDGRCLPIGKQLRHNR